MQTKNYLRNWGLKALLVMLLPLGSNLAQAQNLITNGSFESGTTDWNNLVGDDGVATYSVSSTDVYSGAGALTIAVTTLGANPWSIQSMHTATALVKGQPYTLTFYAKSATAGSALNAVIQDSSYLAQSFTLSASWTKYEWTFTAADHNPLLRFQYSNVDTYSIDAVQMVGLNATGGENLLTNGSFESGVTNWLNLAGDSSVASFDVIATDAIDSIHSLKTVVSVLGKNPWSIQSIHDVTTLTLSKPYILSFYAKADVAGTTINVVIQNTSYLSQSFTLTTTWTKYEWAFAAAETDPQVKFQYPNVATYFVDDVRVVDPSGTGKLNIAIAPATSYQTMVGFGGALTWYCDMVTKNPKKSELVNLMFSDMGTDIVRFKNWYYPKGYPATKSTDTMEVDYFKGHFDATNELYTLAKQANNNIEVLLSSWTPPSAYKSNGVQPEGTLKKNNGQFMYEELGSYYKDVLDSITFNPDYFSFQNEPGYINSGWATCEWRPTETTDFPGYDKGFDAVYNAIKTRSFVPKLIGPETENLGSAAWNSGVNTFRDMTTPVVSKPYLYGYAYHLYNFAGSPGNISANTLNMVKNEFGDKPNFMTEFSSNNFDWLQTADAIHQTVVEANASAYIYWELMWDTASKSALIKVDNDGFTIGDNYYTLKHYAKYIDKGYKRVAVTGGNSLVKVSAFLNPTGDQVTLVALNNNTEAKDLTFDFGANAVGSATAYRSESGNFYQTLGAVNLAQGHTLPAKSLTTFVVNLDGLTGLRDTEKAGLQMKAYPNPFENAMTIALDGAFQYQLFSLSGMELERGSGNNQINIGQSLSKGTYLLKTSQNHLTNTVIVNKY